MTVDLADLLYQALSAELGVVVETNDPERLRQKLYAIRKEIPEMECLSLIISPLNGMDLWIIKQPKDTVNVES